MTHRPLAVVTGANGGIGALLVQRFALDHDVVGLDRAFDREPAEHVTHLTCDLADEASIDRAFTQIGDDPRPIATLVNCAAVFGDFRPTHRIGVDVWDSYFAVNSRGAFLTTQRALPSMVEAGHGRIVHVSSISSTAGGYRQAHYAASKAALIGLSNTVAMEYAPVGITSNCVLPGVIENPQIVRSPQDVVDGALRSIPARRFARPDEVVEAVMFLARPDIGYINGVSLPVDGGTSLLGLRFSRDIRFDGP